MEVTRQKNTITRMVRNMFLDVGYKVHSCFVKMTLNVDIVKKMERAEKHQTATINPVHTSHSFLVKSFCLYSVLITSSYTCLDNGDKTYNCPL